MHPSRSTRVRQRDAVRRVIRSTDAYAFFDLLTDAFEQYGARRRTTDFRRGRRLGTRGHLSELSKPTRRPERMTQAQYDETPATLTVCALHIGGRSRCRPCRVRARCPSPSCSGSTGSVAMPNWICATSEPRREWSA